MGPRLASAATLAFLAATTVPSAAAAPPASHFPGVADSAGLTGQTLVAGTVRDSAGRAAEGVEAVVLATASEDMLASMKPGDQVKMVPVGRGTTNMSGRFAIRVDPAVQIGAYVGSSGRVNFQVLVDSADGFASWSFTAHADAASAGTPADASRLSDGPTDAEIVLGGAARTQDGVAAPTAKTTCTESLQSTIGTYWDSIAETYTHTKTNVDWVYEAGSTSTLGVGYSLTGAFGSFTASGTTVTGSTATINIATDPVNVKRVHQTRFELGKYYDICWYDQGGSQSWYLAKTKRWIGGHQYYTAASYPAAANCSPYLSGDKPEIDDHKAVTWSNGYDVSAGIGIDLQSSTGFTTVAKQSWTFLASGSICGTNDYPEAGGVTVVGS